jgi:ATP adenylyltransferase/5',5'''-P-1,P-4-tetraphosphate phosphorylase II
MRLDDYITNQQQVDNVDRVVWKSNRKNTTTGHGHDKVAMPHRNLSAAGEMNDERLEWLRVVKLLDLFDCHFDLIHRIETAIRINIRYSVG